MEKQIQQAHISVDELFAKFIELSLPTTHLKHYQHKIAESFAYSDFIKKIALQYPAAFANTLARIDYAHSLLAGNNHSLDISYYESAHTQLREQLTEILQSNLPLQSLEIQSAAKIRQFRHIHMLEIAFFDIHKMQSIETSLLAVSHLADNIITSAYDCLYTALSNRYGTPQNNQPLLIMGMGKLGGKELNFSSDIDLIFAYPRQGETTGKKPLEHQVFFTRLAQKLINALHQITQDAFAYRVDMRLRPMGESGPLVLPFSALENYYQEQGRPWERFAMQKMRIINHTPFNDDLYAIIKPFVYRKYIDFTSIDSIREMKELIEKEVRRRQIKHNIKLGQGGIREVEFFVQSLQLIHAGRQVSCQLTSILQSMQALQSANLCGDINMAHLKSDYLYLRQIEHYLQMFNDEQTQILPFQSHKVTEELASTNQVRLFTLLGESSFEQLICKIDVCMARIHDVFQSVVKDANNIEHNDISAIDIAHSNATRPNSDMKNQIISALDDIWQLSLDKSEAITALEKSLSDNSAEMFVGLIFKFKKKTERAGVSPRAVKSINKLMPLLLSDMILIKGEFDDEVFEDQSEGVFGILQTICGRVTYIDLLLEHPEVRHRLLHLCKKSAWVSQQIAQYPILLDELLHPLYLDKNELSLEEWKTQCTDNLRQLMLRVDIEDEEQVMDRLREFKHTTQLRVAAADISGTLAINQVSDKLTLLAEVIIQQVINLAWSQMQALFGQPQKHSVEYNQSEVTLATNIALANVNQETNNELAVIAYGKFGGIELSYGSDLDVVFLHNADLTLSTSNTGTRENISNQEFYIKLVKRICHICTTKTYNGILYDIDLRLRPSGNSGLLVSHINTFFEYQQNKAWTWEHQALVRSRLVTGSPRIAHEFDNIRNTILSMPKVAITLKQEVLEMREKMRKHLNQSKGNLIDIKQTNGGIVDVEFMVQYLILANAHQHHGIAKWSDNLRLLDALLTINTITPRQQKYLIDAYLTLRHASHRVQLANRKLARGGDKLSKKLARALENVNLVYSEVFSD